jgi:ring-1,2-phenylacetyl-CoA epoxidase subunit PaaC
MLKAIDELWRYTGEMFIPADYEKDLAIDFAAIKKQWDEKVKIIFDEATLTIPEKVFMQTGGKTGVHTEHLGYILTELQYVQRAYPNSTW